MVLTLLGGCMVASTWASNLMWTLLAANWVLEGRWREKWQLARESRMLHALWALLLAFVVSALRSSSLAMGLDELRVLLPLMVVGTVTLTTPAVTGRTRNIVLWLFAGTVFVVSVISAVRLAVIPNLPYRLAVPYISHIRFSLCCCVTFLVACNEPVPWRRHRLTPLLRVALGGWMAVFILLIRSYTAIAVLVVATAVVMATSRRHRRLLWLWLAVLVVAATAIILECRSYYRPSALERAPLAATTPNGRPYSHHDPSVVECGSCIDHYICHEEMASQWAKRSALPFYGNDPHGFRLEATLIRYLNALGLPKDSVGVASLTDAQVREVESGVPNPVALHGNPLRRMVYPMLFEWELYRCYGTVTGSSVLQRVELWHATLRLIRDHLWTGVPIGDLIHALNAELAQMRSPLTGRDMLPHSQYLTLIAIFGLPLFLLVLVFFLRVIPGLRCQGPLMTAWVAAVLLSFLTENTLGTNAGILFCTFFLAFRHPSPRRDSSQQ